MTSAGPTPPLASATSARHPSASRQTGRVSAFTGERPGWDADFDYDHARHLAAYRYAATLVAHVEIRGMHGNDERALDLVALCGSRRGPGGQ